MSAWGRLVSCLSLAALAGCATYDERLEDVHAEYYGGRTELVVRELEVALKEAEEDGSSDAGVLRLELAMACQTAGLYSEAVEHLKQADAELEVLDYTDDPIETIASFAFAPEAREYRASPPERVLINTQNMLNQLLADDLRGAEVEARRLTNLLVRSDLDPAELYANRFAWGLAGLVLLAAGDPAPAADAFQRARGSGLESPQPLPGANPGAPSGTLLVVAQTGRIPIRREAVYVFPAGMRTVRINLPSLVSRPAAYDTVRLTLDGEVWGQLPVVFDLGRHARVRFDDELPRLIAAAVSQALPRALLSESIGAAAKAAAKGVEEGAKAKDDSAEAQVAAALAGLTVELIGGLVASFADWVFAEAQGTDTRSWTLLPEHLRAARIDLPPGRHELRLALSGRGAPRVLVREVDVPERGLAVINVSTAVFGGEPPESEPPPYELAESEIEEALRLLESVAQLRAMLH